MIDILIVEWNNKCEQFIKDYQSKHKWNKEKCLVKIWYGIVSTKYLNLTLIEKIIEILPSKN